MTKPFDYPARQHITLAYDADRVPTRPAHVLEEGRVRCGATLRSPQSFLGEVSSIDCGKCLNMHTAR